MNALALITATIEPGSTSLAQQLKAIGFQQMPASRTYANYGHTDSGDYMDTRVGYLRPRVRVWMSRGLRGGPDTVFVCVLGLTVWLGDFQETQAAEIVAAARKALKLYKLIVSERDRVLLYGSEDLVVRLVHHYYPDIAVSTIKSDLCNVKTGGLRGLPRNVAEATVEPQQATVAVAARMLMAVTGHTRVTKAAFWEVLEGGPDYVKVYITPHSSDTKLCASIRVDILGTIELVLKPGDRVATFTASVAKTLAQAKEVAASLPLVQQGDQQKVDFAYHSAGLLFPGKHIPLGSVYKMQKDVHVTATVEPGQARLRLCTIEFPLNPGRAPDHEETETEKESREWREHDSATAMRKELVTVFAANHVEVEATQPECDDDVWKVDVDVKAVSPRTRVTSLVAGLDKLYLTWEGRAFHGDRFTEHKINSVKLTRDLTRGSEHYVHATVEPHAFVNTAAPWDFQDEYTCKVRARHPNLHDLTCTLYSYKPYHNKIAVVFEAPDRLRESMECKENQVVHACDHNYKLGLHGSVSPEKYVQQLWYVMCKAQVEKLGSMLKPGSNFMRMASQESLARVRSNFEAFEKEIA